MPQNISEQWLERNANSQRREAREVLGETLWLQKTDPTSERNTHDWINSVNDRMLLLQIYVGTRVHRSEKFIVRFFSTACSIKFFPAALPEMQRWVPRLSLFLFPINYSPTTRTTFAEIWTRLWKGCRNTTFRRVLALDRDSIVLNIKVKVITIDETGRNKKDDEQTDVVEKNDQKMYQNVMCSTTYTWNNTKRESSKSVT